MFASRQLIRFFNASPVVWNTSKADLMKLRKKTGYTFANCKKALDMHSNDIEKAEKWLHEQAQAMGWSKATNLGGRKATEGLVAVIVNKNHGAMVELNCETDFVSRNSSFQTLAAMIANSCINQVPQVCSSSDIISKEFLDGKKLGELPAPDGKTLADHVALQIGVLGENMILKRAVLIASNKNTLLSAYSHPAPQTTEQTTFLGKYGAIVAFGFKGNLPPSETSLTLGKSLCQHVIGMNPKVIGDPEKDQPQANADDETKMIYQDFILDPETKVNEVLDESNAQVVDFVRFECGESDQQAEEPSPVRAQA